MTTTIIYACGCIRKIETEKPLTKEQRQAEKEQRCPACRLHEPGNVFGYGGDVKAGGCNSRGKRRYNEIALKYTLSFLK